MTKVHERRLFIASCVALGLSIMGGLGMLSVSFVLPIMGRILDSAVGSEALRIMSALPAALILLYGGLYVLRRSRAVTEPAAA